MVVSAAQAHPNALLRQARETHQLTQDEVADELCQLGAGGVTGNLVSKWERGICRPSPFHRRLLCQYFEATPEELGFARQRPGVPTRGALPSSGMLDMAATAAIAAGRKRASAEARTLDELDEDVERFAHECLGVAHAELLPQVWDDWQEVEHRLDGRQSLKERARLTLLGGQLAYFLARLSFNMSDYTAARRHAALAWKYAQDVEQPVLCASVKTLQGTIAFYAGQHQRSLDYLQAAVQYDTSYTSARIAANTARAYAALGDRPHAEHALAVMERQEVDLPIQPGDSPYTPAAAMSALASTLARLGEGERAENYARQAVALHDAPGQRFEDWGNAMLNLASALVLRRQPEPEEAARLGLEVMMVPEGQRTETVRRWAADVVRLLGLWRTAPAVQEFADEVREYRPAVP